jgi:nitrogenase molybdenum-iron protein alpha/beta subunit
MEGYTMAINRVCMDGFTGALMAAESFSDGRAVLHGPGGCRAYHALLSSRCYPRAEPEDFIRYSQQYFFGRPRMPCTFIDEDGYINGSEKKLEECSPIICGADEFFNVFIKSPGAALIGDNITDAIERSGYRDRAMAIEESLISQPFSTSYDHTIRSIIEWKAPKKKDTIPRTVNILGMPISSSDWQDALFELTSMLGDMGITVISSPGAGCSSAELEMSTAAECNVCVCPEYCRRTAALYESEFGIPTIFSETGAPVGFDAVEQWAKNIGSVMNTNTSKVDERIRKAKERVFRRMNGSFLSKRVKLAGFTIMADSSVTYPLMRWLNEYLCMLPVSISVDPGEDAAMSTSIIKFLEKIGSKETWNSDPSQKVDFMFADGHTAETQTMVGNCMKGIDIAMPSLAGINFIPRPVFGMNGSMYILDEIFRSL